MSDGIRHSRESWWRPLDALLAFIIIGGLLFYLYDVMVGARGLDPTYIVGNFDRFVFAGLLNLYVTSVAFVVGMGIGFFLGWLRTARAVPLKKIVRDFRLLSDANSRSGIAARIGLSATVAWFGLKYAARRVGDGYVELVRGTPLFVQILFVWSVLVVNFPNLFATPAAVALNAGLLALTLNTGGYQSEIFRGGFQTVHSGQVEAGRALGLSRLGTLRHIVLPQTLRLIIPPLTNEWIGLFKASTLLFVLGVRGEITFLANTEAFRGNAFEVFAIVTGLFLLITVSLAKVVQILEVRFRIPGLGIQIAPTERLPLFGRPKPAGRVP